MNSGKSVSDHGIPYLHQLEALHAELERAMEAIAGNALASFEDSLLRQQDLCRDMSWLARSLQADPEPWGRSTDLLQRLQSASTKLHDVNRCYRFLLKQSAHSNQLLNTLTGSYADPKHDFKKNGRQQQTWSCEV